MFGTKSSLTKPVSHVEASDHCCRLGSKWGQMDKVPPKMALDELLRSPDILGDM